MTSSQDLQQNSATVAELLEHRAQLQDWLRRLDEFDDTPPQVAQRVRQDYEQRLEEVITELGAHSESLTADRERLEEARFAAAQRHDAAADTLEEVRLRHRIGEVPAEEWDERRPELEAEVEVAAGERSELEEEIEALDELLMQITVGVTDTPAIPERSAEVEAEPEAQVAEEDDATELSPPNSRQREVGVHAVADFPEAAHESEVEEDDSAVAALTVNADDGYDPAGIELDSGELDDDDDDAGIPEITRFGVTLESEDEGEELAPERDPEDYTFLEELDRAIAATAPKGSSNGAHKDDEASPETRPQPGLKCPACGYSNDASDWYCGVCGVDLA